MIQKIQNALSDDLLKPKYRKPNMPSLYGHCYVASEALYHMGAKEQGFRPCWARDDNNVVHWWLQDNRGRILDPTANQYTDQGLTPPYDKGRLGGFLTRQPSKRTKALMEKL